MRKKLLSLLVLVMEAYGVLPSYGKMELKETLERGDWNVMLYGDDEKAHDWSFRVTQGGVNLFTITLLPSTTTSMAFTLADCTLLTPFFTSNSQVANSLPK